jgi:RNA polymerase sigma-70 factor (ECF subfamily)
MMMVTTFFDPVILLEARQFCPPLRPVERDDRSDEELIAALRREPACAQECLDLLFRRYHQKVAGWCLRFCADREEAADLAQDVFLRVQERLATFRGESRFSTWLYTVARSVALNHGERARRRHADPLDEEGSAELVEPSPPIDEELERGQELRAFREVFEQELDPLEAKVLYLHYVNGVKLSAITDLLGLDNKSGAKAYIVSGGRKLKRRFGLRLARPPATGAAP